MPKFSQHSKNELATCAPELAVLFNKVVEGFDCRVIEGHRSEVRQRELYSQGKSKVLFGKHNHYPSLAADVAPYPVDWNNTNRFYFFAGYVLGIADDMGIGIRWGGDWDGDRDINDQTFFDLVHFELLPPYNV
jgi:peptidoglycan L-alanyl-D-glutamate endopeptidase CwlK